MSAQPVIDADGHVIESDRDLFEYLEAPYSSHPELLGAPFFPTLDGWNRAARRIADGQNLFLESPSPGDWVDFLDQGNIELAVLFPTNGLGFGLLKDVDWSVVLARAYNNWLHDSFLKASPRLKGMALIPAQSVPEAIKELRRAVSDLGMVGAILPAVGLRKPLGHPDYFPLYAAAQDLDIMLAVHAAPAQGLGFDGFERLIEARTLSHPFGQMIQMTSMMYGGVYDAFPRLRVAYMEAGAGWVPYLMERLDMEYEHRRSQAPQLTQPPSDHLRSGRIFIHSELEEAGLSYALGRLRDDIFFMATDYPHERKEGYFAALHEFEERDDLSAQTKRNIVYETARRLYKLEVRQEALFR